MNIYCQREYGFPAADERLAAAHALRLLNVAAQRNRLTLAELGTDLVQRTSNQA
jgi:hypothetical protein